MESELRALLKRKAHEMDLPRTPPDGMIRRIRLRRAAIVGVGTALLVALALAVWAGAPHLTRAEPIRPVQQKNERGVILRPGDAGRRLDAGWVTVTTFEPDIRFRLDEPGWKVNLNESEGYFNLNYRKSVISIVSYSKVFDPTVSLGNPSSRVEPPDDIVAYLRDNPHLRVDHVEQRVIGDVPAVAVKVTGLSPQKGIG